MRNSPLDRFMLIGIVATLLAACNGAGNFGAGAIGGRSGGDSDENSGDSESDDADVPVEVSGSFLTCAFMDSSNQVANHMKDDPQGNVDVACGLFRPEDGQMKLAAIANLDVRVRLYVPGDEFINLRYSRLVGGSDLHVVTNVPMKFLAGTIQMDVRSRVTPWVAFRKSIPTIVSFNAKNGFDIDADMEAQGVSLAGDGSFSIERGDGAAASSKLDWFRDVVAPMIVATFGPSYAEPATQDQGTQVWSTTKSGSQQSGDGPSENFNSYEPRPSRPKAQPTPEPSPVTKSETTTEPQTKQEQPASPPAPAPATEPAPATPPAVSPPATDPPASSPVSP